MSRALEAVLKAIDERRDERLALAERRSIEEKDRINKAAALEFLQAQIMDEIRQAGLSVPLHAVGLWSVFNNMCSLDERTGSLTLRFERERKIVIEVQSLREIIAETKFNLRVFSPGWTKSGFLERLEGPEYDEGSKAEAALSGDEIVRDVMRHAVNAMEVHRKERPINYAKAGLQGVVIAGAFAAYAAFGEEATPANIVHPDSAQAAIGMACERR